jgi:hypothetical protein
MREGKYVGQVDKVRARFDPAQRRTEQIFAVMPYRVEGLDVDLPGRSVRAGEPVAFTARVRPAEAQKQRHVIGLRATDPQGRSPRWHRAAFETENGVARCRFDPACNEARGPWKLALTDAATGAQTQVDLTVE